MLVQFDVKDDSIKHLLEITGDANARELFENSLALLQWVVKEIEANPDVNIGSIDVEKDTFKQLHMPIFATVQIKAKKLTRGWELSSTESFVIQPDADRLVNDDEVEVPCVSNIQKLAEQAIEEIQNMSVDDLEAMLIKHGYTPVRLTDSDNHVFNIPIGSVVEVTDVAHESFKHWFWVLKHNEEDTYGLSGGSYLISLNEGQLKEYISDEGN